MQEREIPKCSVFANEGGGISLEVEDTIVNIPMVLVPFVKQWLEEVEREVLDGRFANG